MRDVVVGDSQQFTVSASEIARRVAAFERLSVSTVVATCVFAVDLMLANVLVSVLLVLALVLVLLAFRAWLVSGFRRFASTSWTVAGSTLERSDDRSSEQLPLALVRSVRTKRTTAGGIREIKIDLDGGRSVFVNGLQDLEGFRAALLSRIPQVEDRGPLQEIIDFDHPLFYVFLGIAIGLSIALLGRSVISSSDSAGRNTYAALAVYSLALGAYWLRAKPVSGRYGKRGVLSDYVFGFGAVCVGVGAAMAALLR